MALKHTGIYGLILKCLVLAVCFSIGHTVYVKDAQEDVDFDSLFETEKFLQESSQSRIRRYGDGNKIFLESDILDDFLETEGLYPDSHKAMIRSRRAVDDNLEGSGTTPEPLVQPALFEYSISTDTRIVGDDVMSPEIKVDAGIPYANSRETSIYIGSNGIISFQVPYNSFSPNTASFGNFICPYWTDIDQRKGGNIYYRVFDMNNIIANDREETKSFMDLYSSQVNSYQSDSTFDGTWALLVTYDKVHPYLDDLPDQVITFQVLLITDGLCTYAFYLYQYDAMKWLGNNGNIVIGYNQGGNFEQILFSQTYAAYTIDQFKGNTGDNKGYWFFKIGCAPSATQLCLNWYFQNRLATLGGQRLSTILRFLPRCPCNRFRIFRDRRWYLSRFENTRICYTLRPSFRFNLLSKECCYRFGRYISQRPNQGSSFAYHPLIRRRDHYNRDTLPKRHCCEESNRYCYLYYSLRPAGTCFRRRIFFFFWVFGDPHITTIDGRTYTFNGRSEYTLLHMKTQAEELRLQGRTDLAETDAGKLTNATIFSAFAVKDDRNATFQVELDSNKTGLVIFGNGKDYTREFYANTEFNYDSPIGTLSLSRNGSDITAVFDSGISLTVTLGVKLLTIGATVPSEYQNNVTGLMGNFNGDPDDDFITPDGIVLPSNMTERQIFTDFGQLWKILPIESLFTYPEREGPADYAFPDFVPLFLDEQPESVQNESFIVCGGKTNLACIYDFVATGSQEVAAATRTNSDDSASTNTANANTSPEINGTTVLNAIVGQASSIVVEGSDAEDTDVSYNIINQPDSGFAFNNGTGTGSWTPSNTNQTSIGFTVVDSVGVESPQLDIEIRLCDGCSGQGACDHNTLRQGLDGAADPSFQLVVCICNPGWTGVSCGDDANGCATDPCLTGQNCTDLSPSEQDSQGIGYNCSACPTGYTEGIGKCNDVNECNTTNVCDQTCLNTDGSYTCSCNPGYRKIGFRTCRDINECDERTSRCTQLCTNTDGSYTCTCRPGYDLDADGVSCTADNDILCANSNCTQGCSVIGGLTTCFCNTGYLLNGDGINCDNEDECGRNPTPCSQVCSDTDGSFNCSCHTGYSMGIDGRTCEECQALKYGVNCAETCECGDRSTACDRVKGCVCKTGLQGLTCSDDINECSRGTFECSSDTTCSNTLGSYDCNCQSGYQKVDGVCQDINECDDPSLEDCNDNTNCQNTMGSFTCECNPAYRRQDRQSCTDIDECATKTDECQQLCENVDGGYNCKCEYGFALGLDRLACIEVADVCAAFEGLNCSYACTPDLEGNTAACYCENGYKLAADQQTCLDIDECASNMTNQCTHLCSNQLGTYLCSCPIGKKIENDGRTCTDCDNSHWGDECANECACGNGASDCDKVQGCICKDGWQGMKCDQDKDECATLNICPELSTCKNLPGNYSCVCRDGYLLSDTNVCEDVNECSSDVLNDCDSICNNTIGGNICSCYPGFVLKSGKCEDIDECETGKDNCEQLCRNEAGSYACECRNGYRISDTDASRCINTGAANCTRTDCDTNCEVALDNTETCFCLKGFKLNINGTTCEDINECVPNPCAENCTQSNTPGEYLCSCPTAGFKVDVDEISCKECDDTHYGLDCEELCNCEWINTLSCNKTVGTCNCRSGWESNRCDADIDECTTDVLTCGTNSVCVNTNGSAICECSIGHFKSNGSCIECDDTHYGINCESSCSCVVTNVESCNKTNGDCTCKDTWSGATCDEDVNECDVNTTLCGPSQYQCVNFDGGYRCDCSTGYVKDANGVCIDDDECPNIPCAVNEQCTNIPGNYTCSCKDNYQLINGICEDIDECKTNNGGCDHNCTNTNGSFTCQCMDGYSTDDNGVTCKDIDECLTNNGGCDHNCTNTNGSFTCQCMDGYSLGMDGLTCSDIDECETNNGGCDHNCTNTNGSFTCQCMDGYSTEDIGVTCTEINECLTNNGGCDHNCTNTNGSFTCQCMDGYSLGMDGLTCSDIDECETNNGGCDHNCTNTNGSFTCQCMDGYSTDDNGETCTDTDECLIDNGGCHHNCSNNNGSFTCGCAEGFRLNDDMANCTDLGACGSNNGGCAQTCENSGESVICGCHSGYTINNDNTTCSDIKECEINNGGCLHTCNNVNGSYNCECHSGFELQTDNRTCADIDECLDVDVCNVQPNSECVNVLGRYNCICKSGFKLVGIVCKDIDECEVENGGCGETCKNLPGNYTCECRAGYGLNSDNITCSDIDECKGVTVCNNKDNYMCQNTDGNYMCVCKAGFEENGTTCNEIDECKAKTSGCGQTCSNTIGSYVCSCNDNSVLNIDNKTCSDKATVEMSLTLQATSEQSAFLSNKTSDKYKAFETFIIKALRRFFTDVTNIASVQVLDLRNGSIIVDYLLVIRAVTAEQKLQSTEEIAAAVHKLLQDPIPTLTVNGTIYNLNELTVNGASVVNLNLCDIYKSANGTCDADSICDTKLGKLYCRVLEETASYDLIIGLGVGIPVFFMIIVVIAIFIFLRRRALKSRNEADNLVNGNGSQIGSPFASSLPKRISHGPGMHLPYSPSGLSSAGSSSDSGTRRKTKKRKGRDDFRDSAWYDNRGTESSAHDQIESNFSWDYLYRMLTPDTKFEIRRPKIGGSPDPAFAKTKRQSAA